MSDILDEHMDLHGLGQITGVIRTTRDRARIDPMNK